MDLLTILFMALGLSMDAVAVAMANGCASRKAEPSQALRLAFFFGFFQMLMPVIGWLAGMGFKKAISGFDHWLAFILLAFIGGIIAMMGARLAGGAVRPGSRTRARRSPVSQMSLASGVCWKATARKFVTSAGG